MRGDEVLEMVPRVQFGCLLVLLGLFLVPSVQAGPVALLLPDGGAERVRQRYEAGEPLARAAYRQLVREAEAYLAREPQPLVGLLRVPRFYDDAEGHRAAARPIRGDSRIAHTLALAYAVTGDERFGEQAVRYLLAWVESLEGPGWGTARDALVLQPRADTPIVIGTAFPNFLYAYALVEERLSGDERTAFADWLRRFVSYYLGEELYPNNHHNFQSLFLLCAGRVLRDDGLVERALRYYGRGLRVQIHPGGRLPRELRRGEKGSTYTLMALEAMVQFAVVAKNAGVAVRDWTSAGDAGLQDAVGFLASFLQDPAAWPDGPERVYPSHPGEWGYLFEFPYLWWGEEEWEPLLSQRPYGHHNRAYTLLFATLLTLAYE